VSLPAASLEIVYFRSPADLRAWFDQHHQTAQELWVGYYKKNSREPSITWPESVDEALCFGWIDGIRRSVDEMRYTIRFTPRRPGSTWSAVNIARVLALKEAGRMHLAGLQAFEARQENKSGIYSYEQRRDQLDEPYVSLLQNNQAAWDFYQAQPASYRKAVNWWVVSAKMEETRRKRLAQLVEDSANSRTIAQFTRRKSQT
jgi:uncharacterized protein YdeI (YjbR/CyaY-like superfamily)